MASPPGATGLPGTLTAGTAAGVLALLTSDTRRPADGSGWPCLTVSAVGWQVLLLSDGATTTTVVVGVPTPTPCVPARPRRVAAARRRRAVRRGAGAPRRSVGHLEPTCALTTVGALGARLESDDAVREAACTHRSGQPAH